MLLTDIAIVHTKKSRRGGPDETYLMHPFENSIGANAGKFEILRDITEPGHAKVKRSTHVTKTQLAELYAKGLIENYGFRLRLRPGKGEYPGAPPGKKVPMSCIQPGSSFDRLMQGVDRKKPVSDELKQILLRVNVKPNS
jgi:hypothetical protein